MQASQWCQRGAMTVRGVTGLSGPCHLMGWRQGRGGERHHLISLDHNSYTILLGILEDLEGIEVELMGADVVPRQSEVGKCGSLFRSYSHPFLVKRPEPDRLPHARKTSCGRESKVSRAWSRFEKDFFVGHFSQFFLCRPWCDIFCLLNGWVKSSTLGLPRFQGL